MWPMKRIVPALLAAFLLTLTSCSGYYAYHYWRMTQRIEAMHARMALEPKPELKYLVVEGCNPERHDPTQRGHVDVLDARISVPCEPIRLRPYTGRQFSVGWSDSIILSTGKSVLYSARYWATYTPRSEVELAKQSSAPLGHGDLDLKAQTAWGAQRIVRMNCGFIECRGWASVTAEISALVSISPVSRETGKSLPMTSSTFTDAELIEVLSLVYSFVSPIGHKEPGESPRISTPAPSDAEVRP